MKRIMRFELSLLFLLGLVACEQDPESKNQCGNGQIDDGEECDGINLNDQNCASIGEDFTGGELSCNETCQWETSKCTKNSCGNNVVDGNELCDGTDLNEQNCTTVEGDFTGGTLSCNANCDGWDTSKCIKNTCGNNIIDGNELCDGTDLNEQNCTTVAGDFTGGTLGCNANCDGWDTSKCEVDQVLLANFTTGCKTFNFVAPLAGEESHWIATRLTPSKYPFTVTRIVYDLHNTTVDGTECNAGLAHKVQVFVATDTILDATPTVYEEFGISAANVTDNNRSVQLDLSSPLELVDGEHLVISVQNAGTFPNITCVIVCDSETSDANRNWWSNAGEAPFSWATLASFGITSTVTARAYGTY